MIKWQSEFNKIQKLEVLRETKHSVYVRAGMSPKGERKIAKRSGWSNVHDTWQEAKDLLIATQEATVKGLRLSLERENGRLSSIKGMKPPSDPNA